MKRHLLFTYLFLGLNSFFQAQVKLDGIYDNKTKVFKTNSEIFNRNDSLLYSCSTFNHNLSIVKCRTNTFPSKETFGVIDTTGKIVIPFSYSKLEAIVNNKKVLFDYASKTSRGILNSKGKIIYETKQVQEEFWKVSETYLNINNGTKVGLFSISEEQLVLPVEFDEKSEYELIRENNVPPGIYIFNSNYAITRKSNSFQIHQLKTNEKSEFYMNIYIIDTSILVIKKADYNFFITKDIFKPNAHISKQIIDFHNKHFIFQENNKFGLLDLNEKIMIEAIYDDIYFADKKTLVLKKDEKWAFAKYDGTLLTGFEFNRIDKSNKYFLESLFHVAKLDTNKLNIFADYKAKMFNDNTPDILRIIQSVMNLSKRKMLYSALFENYKSRNYLIVESNSGRQLLQLLAGFNLDEKLWDDIYYIPNFTGVSEYIGYRKGKKYGYEANDISYENIYYDIDHKYNCTAGEMLRVVNGNLFSLSWNYNIRVKSNSKWTFRCKEEDYLPFIMKE